MDGFWRTGLGVQFSDRECAVRRNGQNSAQGEKAIIGLSRGSVRMTSEWLGLRHLAEYSDTSERTLRGWINSPLDPLPAVRVGGKILVGRKEFDSWLRRHRIIPAESIDVNAIVKEIVEGAANER